MSEQFGKFLPIILKGLVQNKPLGKIIASYTGKMRGSTDVISAILPAAFPPVTLIHLLPYLKFVDDVHTEIIPPEGRIREFQDGKSRELQSLTSVSCIGLIDTKKTIIAVTHKNAPDCLAVSDS